MIHPPNAPKGSEQTLDPADWNEFGALAHKMLDAALAKMQTAREGRVWNEVPPEMKASLASDLPTQGVGAVQTQQQIEALRARGWRVGLPGEVVALRTPLGGAPE